MVLASLLTSLQILQRVFEYLPSASPNTCIGRRIATEGIFRSNWEDYWLYNQTYGFRISSLYR